MISKKKIIVLLIYSSAIAFLVLMFFMTPFRLDDLAWGGDIGIDRLQSGFAGYNGRYLGNLMVIILTRLPKPLLSIVETVILGLLFFVIYKLLEKDILCTSVFLVLFFIMPLSVFTQTVNWVAGFSNYVITTLLTLTILLLDLKLFKEKTRKQDIALLYFLTFSGQLFVETTTIYVFLLTIVMLILQGIRYKKLSGVLIIQLALSIVGAMVMFSNTAYIGALTQDDTTYKAINISHNILDLVYSGIVTYRDSVCKFWFGINLGLNIFLVIILITVCLDSSKKHSKVLATIGMIFASFFLYDCVDGDLEILNSEGCAAVVSVLFYIYILIVTISIVSDRNICFQLLILLGSELVLMAPTNFVSPIGERCFLITYVFWALIAVDFLRYLCNNHFSYVFKIKEDCVLMAAIILAGIICNSLVGQSLSWKIEALRMESIEECKLKNTDELLIPMVPNAHSYCFGANLSGDYWLSNYKNYYDIDSDVNVVFISYSEYQNLLE